MCDHNFDGMSLIRRASSGGRNASSIQSIPMKREATYPTSSHMCLGNGLTKRLKSQHMSCFDFRTILEVDAASVVRESLSESDLFSLLEPSNDETPAVNFDTGQLDSIQQDLDSPTK